MGSPPSPHLTRGRPSQRGGSGLDPTRWVVGNTHHTAQMQMPPPPPPECRNRLLKAHGSTSSRDGLTGWVPRFTMRSARSKTALWHRVPKKGMRVQEPGGGSCHDPLTITAKSPLRGSVFLPLPAGLWRARKGSFRQGPRSRSQGTAGSGSGQHPGPLGPGTRVPLGHRKPTGTRRKGCVYTKGREEHACKPGDTHLVVRFRQDPGT